ncbi:MAG: endonuclease/exonuclease/phosphatase family protein, partial [Pirellulales bacterium]|nr:endonuclease/exonuclease/phosphatase family protein [Pirellulales bacterium]
YQPYQLARIPYGDFPFIKTEKEAVKWANEARGDQVLRMLSELKMSLKAGKVCFLTGDFNEPSHQDWTEAVAERGRIPIKVAYPTTLRITGAGMKDGFRAVRKDPIKEPGWTWTPTTKSTDPADRHDRIDFVFSSLPDSTVKQAAVVGESKVNAHVVVAPWPTDHRGVVVEYRIKLSP